MNVEHVIMEVFVLAKPIMPSPSPFNSAQLLVVKNRPSLRGRSLVACVCTSSEISALSSLGPGPWMAKWISFHIAGCF